MHLQHYILTNFKNYESQRIDCSPRLNCYVGHNGMGKTNLLDAVYYLCMGKSHFNLPDSLIARHNEAFFRLEGHFLRENRPERIVAKVTPRKKKELERNNTAYLRLSEHVGLLPVVMIAPDDTYLATEGSEARRRFLDNTLSQLDNHYLQQLITYNKVLQQRNALLKQFADNGRYNTALIEAYDQQLLGPGRAIHEARRQFMSRFQGILREKYRVISGEAESIDCTYDSKLNDHSFESLLEDAREKDRILQRTTVGIHKDDLDFTIAGYPLKRFASQGQLKSFVLALKLAQYRLLQSEKKMAPILLLDDIFDKLDNERVRHLLGLLLEGDFGQVFITDTDENRLGAIVEHFGQEYLNYRVDNGKATKMPVL
ncbi:MAG: DNA replication/repair protein RecF [Phaeodactylibacter sp.]|nr:DNA replication/repair protein RecF [Phaeodactylibacter sp.]MCB9301092.1 DNA replication/repair protein RecF [Lewinellaceae bacterium]